MLSMASSMVLEPYLEHAFASIKGLIGQLVPMTKLTLAWTKL